MVKWFFDRCHQWTEHSPAIWSKHFKLLLVTWAVSQHGGKYVRLVIVHYENSVQLCIIIVFTAIGISCVPC